MLAEEKLALEAADFSHWEIYHLTAVHAKLGEPDRAVEILHRSLRQGFVYRSWEYFFQMAAVPVPESEAYRQFLLKFDAEARRLMETY